MNLKQGISSTKAILIIILAAGIAGGGILAYQYMWPLDKDVIINETADWKIYTNEEYGYEIKYPSEVEKILFFDKGSSLSKNMIEARLFNVKYFELKNNIPDDVIEYIYRYTKDPLVRDGKLYIGEHDIQVGVYSNPLNLSIKDWVKKYEICGSVNEKFLEDFMLDNTKGIRIRNLGGCPPGASSVVDIVYLSKNSKIYTIRMLIDSSLWEERVENLGNQVFNQMLSTFRFIEVDNIENMIIFPSKGTKWVKGENNSIQWTSSLNPDSGGSYIALMKGDGSDMLGYISGIISNNQPFIWDTETILYTRSGSSGSFKIDSGIYRIRISTFDQSTHKQIDIDSDSFYVTGEK